MKLKNKRYNKGYMLIEVIIASSIALVMAYFLIDIIIKMANKNNDYYVESILIAEKNIVTKEIMDDINSMNLTKVDCSDDGSTCELTFDHDDAKKRNLTVDKENSTLTYGDYSKTFSEEVSLLGIKTFNIKDSDSDGDNTNGTDCILTISMPAYTNYSKEDYGVKIVIPYNSSETEVLLPIDYTVTLIKGTGIDEVKGTGIDEVIGTETYKTYKTKAGNTVTIDATVLKGYSWDKWSGTSEITEKQHSFRITSTNIKYTANAIPNTYNINYVLNGGSTGSNAPTSAKYNETISISNPTKIVSLIGNDNGTGATIGSNVSSEQKFTGWTSTNIDTSTARYGNTAWTNGNTLVTDTSFKNLHSENNKSITLSANWEQVTLKLPSISKRGYNCNWNTAPNGSGTSYSSEQSYTIKSDSVSTINLYAICTPFTYNITYNANGGSGTVPESQTFNYGDTVTIATNTLNKRGHNFGGWTTNSDGTNDNYNWTDWSGTWTYINGQYGINENKLVLYARWTPIEYTIVYDSNGGSGTVPESQTFNYGDTVTIATNTLNKRGHTFAGWTTNSDGTNDNYNWTDWSGTWSYINGQYGINNDKLLLYARWNANKYTVNYDCNGGTGTPSSQTATFGQIFTVASNTCIRDGYTFQGWYDPTDVSWTNWSGTWNYIDGQYGIANGVLTLKAKWVDDIAPSAPTYTAFYKDGSGNYTSDTWTNKQVNTTLTSSDAGSGVAYMQYKEGVNGSWNTFGFSEGALTKNGTTWSGTEPWSLKTRNQTYYFRACDNADNCSNDSLAYTIKYDLDKPTNISYKAFYADGSGSYSSGTKAYSTVHTTISAIDTESGVTEIQYQINDSEWTKLNLKASNGISNNGTTYSGTEAWTFKLPRNDTIYFRACDKIGNCSDASSVFIIKYSAKYTISFDANGGSDAPDAQIKEFGEALTLASKIPTYYCYSFKGWSESNTATTGSYQAGSTFTKESDTTLYAIWQNIVPTLYYNANGGSDAPASQTQNCLISNFVLSTKIPDKTGYTFIGWNTKSDGSGTMYQAGDSIPWKRETDLTLYAQWKQNTVNINLSVNGGAIDSKTTSSDGTIYTWSITDDVIYRSTNGGEVTKNIHTINYGDALSSSGLANWDNSAYINISKTGHQAVSGSEWICLSGDCVTYGDILEESLYQCMLTGDKYYSYSQANSACKNAASSKISTSTDENGDKIYICNLTRGEFSSSNQAKADCQSEASSYIDEVGVYYECSLNGYKGTNYSDVNENCFEGTTYSDSTSYNASDFCNASDTSCTVVLGVNWEREKYTVSYDANGGSDAPTSQTKTYGYALTLSSTIPTRTGYTFEGWNTKVDGSGITYEASGSYTDNNSVILYAQWKLETYTVSYDANGGSGAPASQTKTYGQALTLSSTIPAREGYKFLGWYKDDPNATSAAYEPGGSYTINAAATMYAVWKYAPAEQVITNLGLTLGPGTPDFSKTSCTSGCQEATVGIYTMEDNYGTSYYFRGDVENNYVKFGTYADDLGYVKDEEDGYYDLVTGDDSIASKGDAMYWRIIRVNGDGSLRIIYDGTSARANGSTKSASLSGWQISGDDTDSARSVINNWYKWNILGTTYEEYLNKNVTFCRDERYSTSKTEINNEKGSCKYEEDDGPTDTYYYSYLMKANNDPNLVCSSATYLESYTEADKGTRALTYPVDFITAEEIIMAGASDAENTKFYLYNGNSIWGGARYATFWRHSPTGPLVGGGYKEWELCDGSYTKGYVKIKDDGSFGYSDEEYEAAVKPVISLRADLTFTGSGTKDDPFIPVLP